MTRIDDYFNRNTCIDFPLYKTLNAILIMECAYWGYRDRLLINNGAIYKGLAVLVSPAMVKHMLGKIHANHLGGDSKYRMARDVLF